MAEDRIVKFCALSPSGRGQGHLTS